MVSSPLMSALVERQNTTAPEVGPCMVRAMNASSDVLIQLDTNKKQEEGRKDLAPNGTGDSTDENVLGTNANRKETSKTPRDELTEKEADEHIAEIVGKVIASQRQNMLNDCDKVNPTVQDVEHNSDTGTNANDGSDGVVPNALAEKQKREFQEWMSKHGNNLYPSRQDKEQLADQLGTSYLQVTRLLANFRRRHLKYKRCAQLTQAKNEQSMNGFEHAPLVRRDETTQIVNSSLQSDPSIPNSHNECEDNDNPPTKMPRMDIAEEPAGSADELDRQRRIDETIHSIFSRVLNSDDQAEQEHREKAPAPTSNEGDAVAAILQLQAHGRSHKEPTLCSPPPASTNYVTGTTENANNKQNHLLVHQFSPTMGPTGFGQFNGQQVVPELSPTSMNVLASPPHHQHPHSLLLTPPSESHQQQHPQAYPAFNEKQQHEMAQQLAFQQFNALQAPQQQSVNMNSLIAVLAQQQSGLASNGVSISNGNPLTQLPMGVHSNQALLYAALMAQTQAGSSAALQNLLQQQLAGTYENGQHQSAAQSAAMMQLAIQKELQIIYQRQHLHHMLANAAAVAHQRQSPQQTQMAAQQPIQQHHMPPLNFVSPPLTHSPASDEASYATSSPHSFAASSSSMLGSSETSQSSPPPTSMAFRSAQNQMNCEPTFGSPPPASTEASYGDLDAFEQKMATRHSNTLNEKPERRLTEKEMQAIHSLINLREGGNTNAYSLN